MALFKKSEAKKTSKDIAKERLMALVSAERNINADERSFLTKTPSNSKQYEFYSNSSRDRRN